MLSCFSSVWLFMTPEKVAPRLPCPWHSSGKTTGVGFHFLLQGILPTQRLNPQQDALQKMQSSVKPKYMWLQPWWPKLSPRCQSSPAPRRNLKARPPQFIWQLRPISRLNLENSTHVPRLWLSTCPQGFYANLESQILKKKGGNGKKKKKKVEERSEI